MSRSLLSSSRAGQRYSAASNAELLSPPLMSPSKSWAVLACLPVASAIALYLSSSRQFRWFLRCGLYRPSWIGYVNVGAYVLLLFAFAATLTFATEAAANRNFHPFKRFGWTLAILVGAPLALPLYWALYLRAPR